jgi:hypothetical protein
MPPVVKKELSEKRAPSSARSRAAQPVPSLAAQDQSARSAGAVQLGRSEIEVE